MTVEEQQASTKLALQVRLLFALQHTTSLTPNQLQQRASAAGAAAKRDWGGDGGVAKKARA